MKGSTIQFSATAKCPAPPNSISQPAPRGHPARAQEDQPAQRINFGIVLIAAQPHTDGRLELFQRDQRLRDIDPGLFLFPEGAFGFVMLVLDLADDGFDQVFDGDQTIHPAIFVNHQRHMHPVALHLLQQRSRRHRRRREQHRAQQPLQAEPGAAAKTVLQRQILEQHQPLRMVQRALVDRQAAEPMFAKDFDQFILADVQRHGDDFHLGDGHIVHAHPAQVAKARMQRGSAAAAGCGAFARSVGILR